MNKIIKVEQPATAPMHITWIINNICTNACSYCPSSLHNGKNHHYDWENARRFFQQLFERYPKVHCSIAGGEPSVSPFLPELVKTFHANNSTVGLTSNAAKTVEYWKNIAPYLNYVCFSWHPEFVDDKFLEKALAVAKYTPVTVRVMMHPLHWQKCVDAYIVLSKVPTIEVENVRVLNWGGDSDKNASVYSEEQLQWFVDNPRIDKVDYRPYKHKPKLEIGAKFHLDDGTIDSSIHTVDYINKGMTNFNGYKCEIGLKSLFISWDGRIRRGNCSAGGTIGNINDPENIQWPDEPIVCGLNICHCTTDVEINKWI
jgi:MoaA/NifB/PqqE/SkfB family radical SAM enzyme